MTRVLFKAAYCAAFFLSIATLSHSAIVNASLIQPLVFQCHDLGSQRVKVKVGRSIDYESITLKTAKGSRLRYSNLRDGSIQFTLSDDQFPLKVKAALQSEKEAFLLDNLSLLDNLFLLDSQCKKSPLPK